MKPTVHVTQPEPEGPDDEAAHFAPIQIMLDGLSRMNEWHIARSIRRAEKGRGVPLPPLYASGVRYREDPPGREDWRDVYGVLARGVGDCDQLVAWRIAELRVAGIPCEPVLKWQRIDRQQLIDMGWPRKIAPKEGVWLVHCLVRFPDGSIEDPSKLLGMGGNFTENF